MAPAAGAVQELLEAEDLVRLRRHFEARRRAGFQPHDMLAQCGGGRQAENEVDGVGAAPVDDLRTAVVAVGPDQEPGVRPIGADRPHQAAQVSADLDATGSLGWSQDRADKPSSAIEHHDRLEAVFVVMSIEQSELLAAVRGVKRVLNVEHNPLTLRKEAQ